MTSRGNGRDDEDLRIVSIEEILARADAPDDRELSIEELAEAHTFEWPPLTEQQAQHVRNLGR